MNVIPSPRATAAAAGVRSAVAAVLNGDDEKEAETRAAIVALIREAVRDELVAAGLTPAE